LSVIALASCERPQQVSESGYGAYEVSLASWGDSALAVAWYDTRDGNAETYMRFLEGAGRPIGKDYRLTHTGEQSYEADVAMVDGGVAVAWYEKSSEEKLRAHLGVWSFDGQPRWSRSLGAPGIVTRNPVVRASAAGIFAAWIEQERIDRELVRASWFTLDGQPRGETVTLGPAAPTTWNLNAAIDPRGIAYVAYDGQAVTRADELYLAEWGPHGVKLAQLTPDDGRDSKYPDIAFAADGTLALTWFDHRDGNAEVYLAIGPLKVVRSDALTLAQRVTDTPGESIGAYLAWNGDRVCLTWSDDTGGAHQIYYEFFAADGGSLEPAHQLTATSRSSLIPAIKPWRDGFVIAWNEMDAGPAGVHDVETRSEVMLSFVR
jgi:hypothetical protein